MSTQIPVKTASGEVFYVQAEAEGPVASAGVDAPEASTKEPAPVLRGAPDEASLINDPTIFRKGSAMSGPADKVLKPTVFSKAVGVIRGLTEDVSTGLRHKTALIIHTS